MKRFLNKVKLKGKLKQPEWSFTDDDGIMHYSAILEVKRTDDITDYIPIYLTKQLFDSLPKGTNFVGITGNIKSENFKNFTAIYISAQSIKLLSTEEYENDVLINGKYLKKNKAMKNQKPYMVNFFLLDNTNHQINRIPVIAWKDLAQEIINLPSGTDILVKGRIQNKKPLKNFDINDIDKNFSVKVNTLSFSIES